MATTSDIRNASRFEVLHGVYAAGAITRQALAEASSLSFATVSNVVAELIEAGVLLETAYEASTGGRPRARLAVNAERGRLAGVAVSETHVRVELFDLALRPLLHIVRPQLLSGLREPDLAETIAESIRVVAGDGGPPLLGAGVSVPAHAVDGLAVVPLFAATGAGHDGSLADRLARGLGVPVIAENPLKAAAIAELWCGAGIDARTLVTVTLGSGVGAGVTLRGALLRGASGSAGEWGHTSLVMDGAPCRCGAAGCVEAYIGAPAILRQWGAPPAADHSGELQGIAALAAALRSGDAAAVRTIEDVGRYLGAGLANLVNIINPDTLVLGGWVVDELGEWLLPPARAAAADRSLDRPFAATRILRSPISTNRTSLGMATFALENFLRAVGVPSGRAGRRRLLPELSPHP